MSARSRLTVNGRPSEYPKIAVSATNSTLPYRGLDYCAHFDGEEEIGGYGYGATSEDAIRDLLNDIDEPLTIDAGPRWYELALLALIMLAIIFAGAWIAEAQLIAGAV